MHVQARMDAPHTQEEHEVEAGAPLDRTELTKFSVETREKENDIQDLKKLLTQFLPQSPQRHEQQS